MRKIYLMLTMFLCGALATQVYATGTNVFPQGSFDAFADKDEVFTVFTLLNGDVADAELLASDNSLDPTSTKMLKLVTPAAATNAWDLQLATPEITLVEGNEYKFSFDIRSEGDGLFRISTTAPDQFGSQYRGDVATSTAWKTVEYTATAGAAGAVKFNFDMGTIAEMVYYVDNIKLTDLSEEPEPTNLVEDGSFDAFADKAEVFTVFTLKNGLVADAELLASDNSLDPTSTKMLKLVTPSTAVEDWDLQLATPEITLVEGNEYKFSVDIRSEGEGKFRISTSEEDQLAGQYWPAVDTGTDWTTVEITEVYGAALTAGSAGVVKLNFDMGAVADMVYYIDNIKLIDLSEEPEPTNLVEDGSFDAFADKDEVFTVFSLLNGDVADAELLASDNSLDPTSTKMLKLVTPSTAVEDWDLQLATPEITLVEGNEYKFSVDIRSEGEGKFRISTSEEDQLAGQYWPAVDTGTDWTTVEITEVYGAALTAGSAGVVKLNFDMGAVADMVYYIDNIKLIDLTGGTVSVVSPEVKKEEIKAYSFNGILSIDDVLGKSVQVYSISGAQVYSVGAGTANEINLPLNKGVYIVVVNNSATKVIVK